MRYLKHLIISGLILGLFSGCSSSRRAFSKAERFEAEGKYEDATYSYADAFSKDPSTSEYRLRFLKARDAAANMRYKMGSELYDRGDYVAALAEFQTAYGLDPTQGRFKHQVELARIGQLALAADRAEQPQTARLRRFKTDVAVAVAVGMVFPLFGKKLDGIKKFFRIFLLDCLGNRSIV